MTEPEVEAVALAKAPAPVVAKINAMVSAALARVAPEAEGMET